MNRGKLEAMKLIDNMAITSPNEYTLDEIIDWIDGPVVNYESMNNAEGRLIVGDEISLITINSNLGNEGRIRFTISHEIGHYLMHKEKRFHVDDIDSLMQWNEYYKMESEANYFAAELLMPTNVFNEVTYKKMFSKKLIEELSNLFQTSVTSTAIRYAEEGYDPVLLVCIKDGEIKWFKKNNEFKFFANIKPGDDISNISVIYEILKQGKKYHEAQEIDPEAWGISDKFNQYKFYEECIDLSQYGYALSFISVRN